MRMGKEKVERTPAASSFLKARDFPSIGAYVENCLNRNTKMRKNPYLFSRLLRCTALRDGLIDIREKFGKRNRDGIIFTDCSESLPSPGALASWPVLAVGGCYRESQPFRR